MSVMQDNREVAIELHRVKKRYRLGQIGGGTLRADLESWWATFNGERNSLFNKWCWDKWIFRLKKNE